MNGSERFFPVTAIWLLLPTVIWESAAAFTAHPAIISAAPLRLRPRSRVAAKVSPEADDEDMSPIDTNFQPISLDRRSVLERAGGFAAVAAGLLLAPPQAQAVKKKNEALCGTGFFEHIYEYKCTSIGDIQDEGYSKGLNSAESGLTDSLMGKLGVESGDAFGDNGATESKAKPSETTKPNKKGETSVVAEASAQ